MVSSLSRQKQLDGSGNDALFPGGMVRSNRCREGPQSFQGGVCEVPCDAHQGGNFWEKVLRARYEPKQDMDWHRAVMWNRLLREQDRYLGKDAWENNWTLPRKVAINRITPGADIAGSFPNRDEGHETGDNRYRHGRRVCGRLARGHERVAGCALSGSNAGHVVQIPVRGEDSGIQAGKALAVEEIHFGPMDGAAESDEGDRLRQENQSGASPIVRAGGSICLD